jgi:hypothetical protein
MVKIDLAVEINGFRETASHISSPKEEGEDGEEGATEGLKATLRSTTDHTFRTTQGRHAKWPCTTYGLLRTVGRVTIGPSPPPDLIRTLHQLPI